MLPIGMIGKPLQGVVDAGRVDAADADPSDDGADVKSRQRSCVRVHDPRQARQHAAQHDHGPRAIPVDEMADEGRAPGLNDHENREGSLDRRAGPPVGFLDLRDKERPGVLNVRGGDHADNADDDLNPSVRRGRLEAGGRAGSHFAHFTSSAPEPTQNCRAWASSFAVVI
jgi:hypothetical protein